MDLIKTQETRKKIFKLDLKLTPAQQRIDNSTARFKIIRAGRKFGKTTYAQKKALDWLKMPGSIHWHIAPTYTHAKLISWEEYKALIPHDALAKRPNDSELMITLKNGSRLHLMGSDNPDALRGTAPSSFTFEEAAFQKSSVWNEIMRPNIIPKKAPGLFISTPKGYNWFYDLEEEAKKLIAQGDKEWEVFHFSIFDNPHMDVTEIEKARTSCDSEARWNQEYLARYESSVGRVFAGLDVVKHSAKIPLPVGKVYRAVDWGMRDNTAGLWGYIRDKKLFVYREYLENNLSAPQQAHIIKEMTPSLEKVERTAISHDAVKEDNEKKGLTVFWHFRQAGIEGLIPSSKDKKHSRQMINDLIRQDRLIIDKDRCPKLWKQLMSYEWKDTAMEKPEDGNDDAVDALHYLVELLQFELFLQDATPEKTYAEKVKEYQEEKKNLQKPKWAIEPKETLTEFNFSNAGGYFD